MLATVAAADSASTVRKKYSVFIYSEAEPPAMYAIYKQTLTLCVLQYSYLSKFLPLEKQTDPDVPQECQRRQQASQEPFPEDRLQDSLARGL